MRPGGLTYRKNASFAGIKTIVAVRAYGFENVARSARKKRFARSKDLDAAAFAHFNARGRRPKCQGPVRAVYVKRIAGPKVQLIPKHLWNNDPPCFIDLGVHGDIILQEMPTSGLYGDDGDGHALLSARF